MGSLDAYLLVLNVEAFVWHEGRYLMLVRGASEEIAPGTLTPPGGKVERGPALERGIQADVLEATLRREVLEETGVEVDDLVYVESHAFEAGGDVIVDLVFLCRYAAGEPLASDAEEVAALEWLRPDEVERDARCMSWTRDSLARVEAVRQARGW